MRYRVLRPVLTSYPSPGSTAVGEDRDDAVVVFGRGSIGKMTMPARTATISVTRMRFLFRVWLLCGVVSSMWASARMFDEVDGLPVWPEADGSGCSLKC